MERIAFVSTALLLIIGGAYVGYSVTKEYKQIDETESNKVGEVINMNIKPSEEMSIQKVRQWYRSLGQKINISLLLTSYPREMKSFEKTRPSVFLFFSSSSCQVCVGEMFESAGEIASEENLNIVSVCTSPTIVRGLMYKPKGISKSSHIIDTTSMKESLPNWITISHIKPMVFFTDVNGSVLNAYFLQEKDFETRKYFTESIKQLLSQKGTTL